MLTKLILPVLLVIVSALCWLSEHYRSEAAGWRTQYNQQRHLAERQQSAIKDMQRRQKSIVALDEKYTRELANAKATIDLLRDDVAANRRRLQLNAICPKQSAAAPGVDDAASPQLTPDAERAYWRLREQIATADKQITGLQEYIRSMQK